MNESSSEAPSSVPEGAPLRSRRRGHPLRTGIKAMLSFLAAFSALVIVLLLAVAIYTQLGPGGLAGKIQVGEPAPDFDLPLLDGGGARVSLSDYRGRPVAVNFWATYCPNCVIELPALIESERTFAEQDFAVVYLNAGEASWYVRDYVERLELEMPVLIDPGKETFKDWSIVGLPTTVWVDREGLVFDVTFGGEITVATVGDQLRAVGELE